MTAPSDESLSISRTKARNPLPICSSKKLRGGLLNRTTSTRPCCSVKSRLPLIVRPVSCEPMDDELDRLAAAHPEHVDGADLEPAAAERPVKLVVRCLAGHQLWSPRRNSRILHHGGVGSGAFQS